MKSLNKKIGIVVLSGALLIGGFVASSKIEVYANNNELNVLCYNYNIDVIDENFDGRYDIQKDIDQLGVYYGVSSFNQIKFMNYHEFKQEVKDKNIKSGMYLVKKGGSMILIGVPISNNKN